MAIKVFADGANLEGMLDMYENGNVQGFTTNPSLMKKGGVTDYRAFAKEVLAHITDVSVSFEVFADDVETMEVEAREIATWPRTSMSRSVRDYQGRVHRRAGPQAFGRRHQGQRHHHLYACAGRRDGRGR